MSSPLLLALDTSTRSAGVALFDGEQVLSETTWLAGREHSTRLLVEIDAALERADRGREELTGLVVARGPGSFTGVRVALSVAKGLSAALGIPVWGLGSLDVLALAVQPTDVPVRAVLEAGRGRYVTALYAGAECVQAPRLATPDGLLLSITQRTVLVGELTLQDRARLEHHPDARVAPRASSVRRAGFLAELGWRRAVSGDPGDAAALDAIYVST